MIDRFKQFIKGSKKSIIDGQIDETIMDHFNDIIDEFNMEPRIYRRLMEDKNVISSFIHPNSKCYECLIVMSKSIINKNEINNIILNLKKSLSRLEKNKFSIKDKSFISYNSIERLVSVGGTRTMDKEIKTSEPIKNIDIIPLDIMSSTDPSNLFISIYLD